MLHCCYNVVTLLLHCCYNVSTLLLHCCFTVATLLLHCRYTLVTLLLHYCYTVATLLLHCCYTVVTLLLHCCYTVVTLLLHCCYTVVTGKPCAGKMTLANSLAKVLGITNIHPDASIAYARSMQNEQNQEALRRLDNGVPLHARHMSTLLQGHMASEQVKFGNLDMNMIIKNTHSYTLKLALASKRIAKTHLLIRNFPCRWLCALTCVGDP
jgi:hypothetical protein